jgi:DNA uptake protein ComE-like DNA-binding protein
MSAFYIPDELPEESAQPPSESQIPKEPQPQEIPETTVPEVRRYDLNTVSRSELMQIPGMTDRIADGILALREQFGRFGNIYELDLADGMDGTYFEEVLREYLYVE